MLSDKLTGDLAKQFAGRYLPISAKCLVDVCCACGIITRLSTRALSRTWGARGYYLCKQCLIKSPARLAYCSKGGMKTLGDPIISRQIREASRVATSTIECRNKIATSIREQWKNKRYRDNATLAAKAWWKNPINKTKVSKAMKTIWRDKRYRDRITAASKLLANNREYLQKASILAKAFWKDPEYLAKMSSIRASGDYINKISATVQALWCNKVYRDRVMAAHSSPEARKKMSISSRAAWQNLLYRDRQAIIRASQLVHTSSIQTMLYQYLDGLGVEYYKEGEQTRIGFYVFDCVIPNGAKKLLIECQGDYWHTLPKHERNDNSKFTYINRYFPEHEIMYVWEHEFYCKDRVLDRLKLKLNISIETKLFEFTDLVIDQAKFCDVKEFLDLYHYLGKDRGGKAIGAYHNGELIACIVFSPPLRQNTANQFGLVSGEVRELSRLCIHPSYHKKNFASWFIKRALKLINYRLVVAYADSTVGHTGTVYKASNFELHHTVPADYWYVDTEGYVMHKRTLYGKAIKMSITESEFASKFGYIKKYGGGKLCYTARNK